MLHDSSVGPLCLTRVHVTPGPVTAKLLHVTFGLVTANVEPLLLFGMLCCHSSYCYCCQELALPCWYARVICLLPDAAQWCMLHELFQLSAGSFAQLVSVVWGYTRAWYVATIAVCGRDAQCSLLHLVSRPQCCKLQRIPVSQPVCCSRHVESAERVRDQDLEYLVLITSVDGRG